MGVALTFYIFHVISGKEKVGTGKLKKKLLNDFEFRENRRSEIRTLLRGRK
jgi:hypothetical protein